MQLYDHQVKCLDETQNKNRVAYYLDMGLGKTYVGSEKMVQLGAKVNLVVCQKSKINDWCEHLKNNYEFGQLIVADLSNKKQWDVFFKYLEHPTNFTSHCLFVGVINYDLIWRRPKLATLTDFTLMLDESSLIQHETSNRTKFITKKLHPDNVILLSGTPTGGKYETLLSQINLLGWNIKEDLFWNQYIDWEWNETDDGFWQKKINGYKNVDRLKRKLRQHGCVFLKTEEVMDLPEQMDIKINIPITKEYEDFRKNDIVVVDGQELVGENLLTQMLYQRQLCSMYNPNKIEAFKDLVQSTEDRLVVFYNFNDELDALMQVANECQRPFGAVNGSHKNPEMLYPQHSILFVQYQAGAMGLNLQLANKIIYFSPPLSSELFEQSKKRIHRIGQKETCFYYYLVCKNSIEQSIYNTLSKRKDYTDKLFVNDI